jgi:hypothetical protein
MNSAAVGLMWETIKWLAWLHHSNDKNNMVAVRARAALQIGRSWLVAQEQSFDPVQQHLDMSHKAPDMMCANDAAIGSDSAGGLRRVWHDVVGVVEETGRSSVEEPKLKKPKIGHKEKHGSPKKKRQEGAVGAHELGGEACHGLKTYDAVCCMRNLS